MSVKVEQIAMEGFFAHARSALELPKTGVVVVTGHNGAGKSSIPEAVAVALWGKTLRGTLPWAGDGRVRVLVDGTEPISAERTRKGQRTTLLWGPREASGQPTRYENTTKAQEALEAVVGSWDVWRRSAVFSSQDASHFTLATDKERKLLLEAILGLEQFDSALEACRGDMAAARAALDNAQREEALWVTKLAERKAKLAELRALAERDVLPPKPTAPGKFDESVWRADLVSLDTMISGIEADIGKLDLAYRSLADSAAAVQSTYASAKRAESLLANDACPTCGQAISANMHDSLHAEVERARKEYETASSAMKRGEMRHASEKEELADDLADLRTKRTAKAVDLSKAGAEHKAAVRAYTDALHAYEWAEKRIAQAQEQVNRAAGEVTEAAGQFVTAKESRERAEAEHAVLLSVERVLGLRGVRAHILGKALAGLEAVGNAWLSRICGGRALSLELKPYSEKATGGVSDAISIEICGAGNGLGYRAASGGERRRIDVALLLALAEVAQAAHGGTRDSTLWFDEVFDALDDDGIESVASALHELGKSRAVVVITHSAQLASRVPATMRLNVEDGKIAIRS